MPLMTAIRTTIAIAFLAALSAAGGPAVPLLSNGGFEHDDWEWRSGWGHYRHEVIQGEAHSGRKSMYFKAAGAIHSPRYEYHGGPIEVSGWCKLRDVKVGKRHYWKFWVTVNFCDANGKVISHADVHLADGTCDWTRFERTIKAAPKGTQSIELSIAMANCTGEAWVDDVQIHADADLNWPAWKFTEQPYYTGSILPEPRSVSYGTRIPIYAATVNRSTLRIDLGDHACRGARFGAEMITSRILKSSRAVRFGRAAAGSPLPVNIVLGRPEDAHILAAIKKLGVVLPTLPAQGHAIRTKPQPKAVTIIAMGADDKGVAYAAASLAQMIGVDDGQLVLRTFELTDWPDFLLRVGSDYMPVSDQMLTRLVMSKMSVYAIQHRAWWGMVGPEAYAAPRKGHSYEKLLKRNRDFVERTGAIDIMMLIHIYVAGGRPKEQTGPVFDIANDDHVADLTRRLNWLYGNSVRNIMICVDDYTDRKDGIYVCKTAAEKKRFGNVGRAHGHLMRRLWDALAPACPDLKLSLVAAPYSMRHMVDIISRESGVHYLRDLAEEMPDDVAVVWTGPQITSPTITRKDWQAYAALVPGQPLYIWDNCQGRSPFATYDVKWYTDIHRDSAWSLMYQNAHFMGWPDTMPAALAANDLMWDLQDYDPDRVHGTACAKAFGPVDYADIKAVNDGYTNGRRLVSSSADRDPSALKALVTRTYDALSRLEALGVPVSVPRRQLASASVTPDVITRFKAIPSATIPRFVTPPTLDGKLDEPAWQTAASLPSFADYRTGTTNQIKTDLFPTECKLGYDDQALYIACVNRHGDVALHAHEDVGKRDGNIFFNSDTVEIFLGPNSRLKDYFHLAVDHTNTLHDERRPKPGAAWNGDWQTAVHKTDGAWTLEMRIPFKTLGISTPESGGRWRANVCRAFGQNSELSCWAPIYGSFHNWTFFGFFEFE